MLSSNLSPSIFIIVGIFLFCVLCLGLYAGKNVNDFSDFALGGRRFSTFTLILTFLATMIGGGSIIGAPSEIYSGGIIRTAAISGIIIEFIVMGLIVGPKILNFKNCITLGDISEKLYGTKMKIFVGSITFLNSVTFISFQLILLGLVTENLLNIESHWGIVLFGAILGIYSSIGGIKAVTYTDVLQFLVLIIAIPILGSVLLKNVGGYKNLFICLPKEKFKILGHKKFYYWLSHFLLWGIFLEVLMGPHYILRMFMANNKNQIKNQFLVMSIFDPAFRILIMFIGLSMVVLYPNMEPKTVIFYAIKNLFTSPIMQGIIISGFIAVIMSSIDSAVHALGVVATNDIIKPLFKNYRLDFLLITRLFIVIISIVSIIIALKFASTTHFRNLSFIKVALTSPIILFPILIGILGLKTDNKSLIFSIISGLTVLFIAHNYLPKYMQKLAVPIGILGNAIVYMISHIIQNKGIVWIKREYEDISEVLFVPNINIIINSIIKLTPTPMKVYNFSKNQFANHPCPNIAFGIYFCINFTMPYFFWDDIDHNKYNLMISLRFAGGIFAGLILVKDAWNKFFKKYFHFFWHFSLLYCLPFVTTMMFLLTRGSIPWLLNVGISIFFLILLTSRKMFSVLTILGIGFALIFYNIYIGNKEAFSLGFYINYYLFYQLLFATSIGLIFAYKKKMFYSLKTLVGFKLGSASCHEIRNSGYSLSCNQFNSKILNKIEKEQNFNKENDKGYFINKKTFEILKNNTQQAEMFDKDLIKVVGIFEKIFKNFQKSLSNPIVYSMERIINETLQDSQLIDKNNKKKIYLKPFQDYYARLPKDLFKIVISNIVRNSFKHGGADQVEIYLTTGELIFRDNGHGIPPKNIEKIFEMHYTTNKLNGSTGVGLGFVKYVIETCEGEVWCESKQGKNSYTEIHIRLPEINDSEVSISSLEESRNSGFKEGEKNSMHEVALKMLKNRYTLEEIVSWTKLSKSEIEEIATKNKNQSK